MTQLISCSNWTIAPPNRETGRPDWLRVVPHCATAALLRTRHVFARPVGRPQAPRIIPSPHCAGNQWREAALFSESRTEIWLPRTPFESFRTPWYLPIARLGEYDPDLTRFNQRPECRKLRAPSLETLASTDPVNSDRTQDQLVRGAEASQQW